MNTTLRNDAAVGLAFVRPFFSLLLAITAVVGRSAEPASKLAEPKTHALFMGADVLVDHDGKFLRVQDVVGSSFVVRADGKEFKIPADLGAIKMKVDRSLKLTGTSVTLTKLTVERAYTEANDPAKQFARSNAVALAGADVASRALSTLAMTGLPGISTESSFAGADARSGQGLFKDPHLRGPRGELIAPGFDPVSIKEGRVMEAFSTSLADPGKAIALQGQMQNALQAGLFDAMEVSFDLSAERGIQKPYVIVMVEYRIAESKPNETKNWVYAAAMEPLGTDLRRFRVKKGGFPPGFTILKSQVHVYDRGQELATNVSEKQVPLTRTEAFTYLLLDYLASHKTATAPARAVMGKLTSEEQARLGPDRFEPLYYVKVSKDGLPTGAFMDTSCSSPADEAAEAAVGNVRFFPALENGRTVAGVAELKFGRLAL